MDAEFRSAGLVDVEFDGMNFRGYAAVFDSPWSPTLTEAMGYVETVARGAFRKALADPNARPVPLTWQHDANQVLATTKSGNLTLREDGKGLLVEAKLPDTTLGRDVREMIKRGDVNGMSYGIQSTREDSDMQKRNGVMYRTLRNVRRLLDVTLTWDPSYDETTVELRNITGLAAVPLQELLGGVEAQTEDAVEALTSLEYRKRADEVMAAYLEDGGLF